MKKTTIRILANSLLGMLLYVYIHYSESGMLPTLQDEAREMLLTVLLMNAAGLVVVLFNKRLDSWFPWHQQLFLRFLFGVLIDTILVLSVIFGLTAGAIYLDQGAGELNYIQYSNRELIAEISVVLFFGVFIFTIFDFTRYSYHQYAVVQIQNLQLARKQMELQYTMLKSQLSPHYLFNCLNTISSLVYQDTAMAEEFIRNFASTYQYILDTHQQRLVKLSEEVAFVHAYIYLMKVRFDEGLRVHIQLGAEVLETEIPPLTLQLLLENAVKHNIISEETPLHITISTNAQQQIVVRNNKTAEPKNNSSFAIGLNNIRRRYSYFTALPVKVNNSTAFTVELPILSGVLAPSL